MQSTKTALSTLLIATVMATSGCQMHTPAMPIKPPHPTNIKVYQDPVNGMTCYRERDHRELVRYIDALESGYD